MASEISNPETGFTRCDGRLLPHILSRQAYSIAMPDSVADQGNQPMTNIDTFQILFEKAFNHKPVVLDGAALSERKDLIPLLKCGDLKNLLPDLLLTLIERDASDDDLVIYFLDGLIQTEESLEEREFQRAHQARTFECFDLLQSEAVLKWLQAIEEKPILRICPDDYKSAVSFWVNRVEELQIKKCE